MPVKIVNRPAAPTCHLSQPLQKLEARRGGYHYLEVAAETVRQWPKAHATRLLCTIDDKVTLHCGLNYLGNGHFFIIIATRYVKALQIKQGEVVHATLQEDPEPLGVALPEALAVLLEQDDMLKDTFDAMTDGKKRSLIFLIKEMKDIGKQVQHAVRFLSDVRAGRSPFKRSVE